MTTLGQKLRELRHQKGYKLNEVAEGADLSISFISLIERDKASISVENLQKLANFYNVRLFQIFQDIEEEDAYIVREDQMEGLTGFGTPSKPTLFMLSPTDNLSFKAILAILPPASQLENIQLQKGEAFIWVKEGQLEIFLPNKKPMTLNKGDSAHLTSFKGAQLRSAANDIPTTLLIVATATTQHLNKQGNILKYHEIVQ
jgi:transcriptional regulator with XRE-family HTH domain